MDGFVSPAIYCVTRSFGTLGRPLHRIKSGIRCSVSAVCRCLNAAGPRRAPTALHTGMALGVIIGLLTDLGTLPGTQQYRHAINYAQVMGSDTSRQLPHLPLQQRGDDERSARCRAASGPSRLRASTPAGA